VTSVTRPRAPIRTDGLRPLLPGLLAAAAIGAAATGVGTAVPLVGAPVIAVLLGLLARAVLGRAPLGRAVLGRAPLGRAVFDRAVLGRAVFDRAVLDRPGADARAGGGAAVDAGSRFVGRYVLQGAVVVLGTGLSVRSVLRTGLASLPVMLGTLVLCLAAAWLLGRLLRIPDPLRTLIGAGTGICGASAIAALRGIVAADEVSMAYAVSTIVVYNITAAVVFPPMGRLLGLSQHAFGLWAGTAVNDTSSVVATGYAYGAVAGRYAVTVKLTRALMIIPLALGVAARARRADRAGERAGERAGSRAAQRTPGWRLVPPFLVLFLLAAAADSTGLVPAGWHAGLARLAGYLVAVALAGVGLGVRPAELRRAGPRPLLFGGLLSVLVAGASLGLQALTRIW
jgi:uncharacterized integral membrane protein (TIGR00698 family)